MENRFSTNEYYNLLRSTNREGIEDLIEYLKKSDFEVAPASTKYHGSYEGGLCDHCMTVHRILMKLVEDYIEFKELTFPNELAETHDELMNSVIIVALLHDISKVNFYEVSYQNKKVYSQSGSKYDENGNYDWQSVKTFKQRDDNQIFIAGNHEETAEFIVRQFIQLRISESVAIAHHHGGIGWDTINIDAMSKIYSKYPLTLLLHEADLLAAYKFV